MRLIENWNLVLKKALSIKFILIAGFFSGLEMILPYIGSLNAVPEGVFAFLAFLATNAAFVSRIVAQKELK
jgi:hypothetical protein